LIAACQLFGLFFLEAQALLQYFISSQVFSHFFRQDIGLPQTKQGFCGKYDLFPLWLMGESIAR